MPAAVTVHRLELVAVTPGASLLRVELAGVDRAPSAVSLVAEDGDDRRRLAPLPTPPDDGELQRVAFGLPTALRRGRLTLELDGTALPLEVPAERSSRDAVAAVALRQAHSRLAELEQALEEREHEAAVERRRLADAERALAERDRLERQLAEHRLQRAQLIRELEGIRERGAAAEEDLAAARAQLAELDETLDAERASSQAEQERLAEVVARAKTRVDYLERRLVEVRAQAGRAEPDEA